MSPNTQVTDANNNEIGVIHGKSTFNAVMNTGNKFYFETPKGDIEIQNNPPDLLEMSNIMSDANTYRVKIDEKMRNGLNAETTCLVIASAIVIDLTFLEASRRKNRGKLQPAHPHAHPGHPHHGNPHHHAHHHDHFNGHPHHDHFHDDHHHF